MPERKNPSTPAPPPCAVCRLRDADPCRELLRPDGAGGPLLPTKITLRRGETLFCEGDTARYTYVVARGVLACYKLMADGRRMIMDLPYPGETLGEDCPETHAFSAEAVTDAGVCLYAHDDVLALVERRPHLGQVLLNRAYQRVGAAREQMLALTNMSARQRVAYFLIRMSQARARRGEAASVLWLPLSRGLIGDYLGLSMETVSRTLTRFRREGLIAMHADTVELRDPDALGALAGLSLSDPAPAPRASPAVADAR